MPIPTMQSVTSSHLHAVGHDGDALYIQFKPGKAGGDGPVFRYPTLDRSAYDALLGAESIGKYYHANIRGQHQGERVGE